ncbi:hypothetical protein Emed_001214 [Eimeria media]
MAAIIARGCVNKKKEACDLQFALGLLQQGEHQLKGDELKHAENIAQRVLDDVVCRLLSFNLLRAAATVAAVAVAAAAAAAAAAVAAVVVAAAVSAAVVVVAAAVAGGTDAEKLEAYAASVENEDKPFKDKVNGVRRNTTVEETADGRKASVASKAELQAAVKALGMGPSAYKGLPKDDPEAYCKELQRRVLAFIAKASGEEHTTLPSAEELADIKKAAEAKQELSSLDTSNILVIPAAAVALAAAPAVAASAVALAGAAAAVALAAVAAAEGSPWFCCCLHAFVEAIRRDIQRDLEREAAQAASEPQKKKSKAAESDGEETAAAAPSKKASSSSSSSSKGASAAAKKGAKKEEEEEEEDEDEDEEDEEEEEEADSSDSDDSSGSDSSGDDDEEEEEEEE